MVIRSHAQFLEGKALQNVHGSMPNEEVNTLFAAKTGSSTMRAHFTISEKGTQKETASDPMQNSSDAKAARELLDVLK